MTGYHLIDKNIHSVQGNPLYTHQSITISGLGLPYFDNVIEGMLALFVHFDDFLPPGTLQPWRAVDAQSSLGEIKAFTFSNPIFLTAKTADTLDIDRLVLTDSMDPMRRLRGRQGMLTNIL